MEYVVTLKTKSDDYNLYFRRNATHQNARTTGAKTYSLEQARRWKTEAGARAFASRYGATVVTVQGRK